MRFRVSKIKCALCSCSILWFLTASVFAGVFGWSFHNWQHEMYLAERCTILELLPNASTATLIFVNGKEYLLPEAKDDFCFAYLSAKLPVYTTRRKLSDCPDGLTYFEGFGCINPMYARIIAEYEAWGESVYIPKRVWCTPLDPC